MPTSHASLATIAHLAAVFLQTSHGSDMARFGEWLASNPVLRKWDRRHVYQACLGRLPECELNIGMWGYASAEERADHIIACLLCDEFRARFLQIFGAALPNVLRVFHVHVPRTAGTSFTRALESAHGSPAWHTSFRNADWLAVEAGKRGLDSLAYMVQLLAQFAEGTGTLFVMGHEPLQALIMAGYVRADDKLCTIVREPLSICLSVLDYVIDTARRNTGRPDAEDWRGWIDSMGCAHLLENEDDPVAVRALLRSSRFREDYSDWLTRMFSIDGTLEGALYALDLTDCAVLLPSQADAWARAHLGLDIVLERRNASSGRASSLLAEEDLTYIREELCARDRPLFEALQKLLWRPDVPPVVWPAAAMADAVI